MEGYTQSEYHIFTEEDEDEEEEIEELGSEGILPDDEDIFSTDED